MTSTPPLNWGTGGISTFVQTHHNPTPSLDTTKVRLKQPFAVCIVGASRGIGAGIAFSYARAGASTLILSSRRRSGLEATAAACLEINPEIRVEIVTCDIESAESVENLSEEVKAKTGGKLDVVAVNSGFSGPVVLKVTDTDPETFARATGVNYIGTFLCAKYLIPLLLENDGGARTFIGIGSFAALIVRGPIANAQYCVSKAAQTKLMEYIHEQYHGEGLAVYNVHPGAVLSEMAEETAPEEFKEYLLDSPDLAGSLCVWLTKDDEKRSWLSGRLVSACWDVDELVTKKNEIVEKDLFKLKMTM